MSGKDDTIMISKHAFILALYASLVAPIGGLFASAIKRANKIKDFADCFPGHGGMTDRMDCQLLMGLFTCVYYQYSDYWCLKYYKVHPLDPNCVMAEKYKNFKVKELQELLQKNGIPHTGKKEDLIERLVKHDERKAFELEALEEEFGGSLDDFDESKLNLDDLTEDPELRAFHPEAKKVTIPEKKPEPAKEEPKPQLTTESTTTATATEPSATAAKPAPTTEDQKKAEEEKKQEVVTKEGSNFKFTPVTFDKPAAAPKPATSPAGTSPASPSKPSKEMSELEKKLERAKRFGVQLDEKAKRELRAQRFGAGERNGKAKATGTGVDPEVLKKRAERFGLPVNKGDSKKGGKAVLDPVEEEKKRKRAERFGLGPDNKKQKQ
ncbi:hypothetical protein EC973_003172 [Apophysomyces ossiformis]|uniref:Phosphatidate cytidylyltransferase n=1 Tax=Apophysomyces ossiformis TaxID=679940 RepID=A0A8H7EL85_9FUNG|nr:hypothetical protein EC973_003172 [Apophysomyces ossiformis]